MVGALPYQRDAVGANFPMITKGCLVRIRPDIKLSMFSGKEIFIVISDVCVDERRGFSDASAGTVGAVCTYDPWPGRGTVGLTHRLFIHDLEVISEV